MFLAKIWFFLLAVVAIIAIGVAMVIPKPAYREVNKAYADSLDRVQHNAHLMLRLRARAWIDAVSGMARDRNLVTTLEQVTQELKGENPKTTTAQGRTKGLVVGNTDPDKAVGLCLRARGQQTLR